MDVLDLANSSTDKENFSNFLKALEHDFINNKDEWENWSVDSYLKAICAWINDYREDDVNFETPDWKTIAAMFYAGKIYE